MRHVVCPICGGAQGIHSVEATHVQCAFCRSPFLAPPGLPPPPHPPSAWHSAPAVLPPTIDAPSADRPAPAPAAPRGMMLEIVFFGLLASVCVAGLTGVLIATGKLKPPGWGEPAPEERPEEVVIVRAEDEQLEPRWSDATRYSLQLNGVKVRIDHAEYQAVSARDERRQVITTSGSYLTIWLHVENRRHEPAAYRSWYGNRFLGSDGPVEARLTDDRGGVYPQKKFAEAREIKGHIPAATLAYRDSTRDTIVFDVPDSVRRAGEVQELRLELPTEAWGEPGRLRFAIPLGLIEGW